MFKVKHKSCSCCCWVVAQFLWMWAKSGRQRVWQLLRNFWF